MNDDERRAYQREYYKKNRGARRAYQARYYQENKAEIDGKKRERRHRGPSYASAKVRDLPRQDAEEQVEEMTSLLTIMEKDMDKPAGSGGICSYCYRPFLRRFRGQQFCRRPACLRAEDDLLAPLRWSGRKS